MKNLSHSFQNNILQSLYYQGIDALDPAIVDTTSVKLLSEFKNEFSEKLIPTENTWFSTLKKANNQYPEDSQIEEKDLLDLAEMANESMQNCQTTDKAALYIQEAKPYVVVERGGKYKIINADVVGKTTEASEEIIEAVKDGTESIVVPEGATIYSVLREKGITPTRELAKKIIDLNPNIDKYGFLKGGQIIIIPSQGKPVVEKVEKKESYKTITVQKGEGIYAVLRRAGVEPTGELVQHVIKYNELNKSGDLAPGQVLKIPVEIVEIKESYQTVTVQKGEGIYGVLRRSGITPNNDKVQEVMKLNGLKNMDLKEGQVLKIPAKE